MIRHIGVSATLAAVLALASPHGAQAGWKRTTLVPNVSGSLATVGLADNGQALAQFTPQGHFDNISAWAAPNVFSPFGYCGTSARTDAEGFDNLGNDVGTCFDDGGNDYGYVHSADGTVHGFAYPGAVGTLVTGIYLEANDSYQDTSVVGTYWTNAQNPQYFGFRYDLVKNSTEQIGPPPGAIDTFIAGANRLGGAWGSYLDTNNVAHGFINASGIGIEIKPPGYRSAVVSGLREDIQIFQVSGTAYDFNAVAHAFVFDGLNYRFPPLVNMASSQAYGINDSGLVVGNYTTTGGLQFGFRWNIATNTVSTFKAPAGSTGFELNGINASGEVAGFYHINGVAIAFVATCTAPSCN